MSARYRLFLCACSLLSMIMLLWPKNGAGGSILGYDLSHCSQQQLWNEQWSSSTRCGIHWPMIYVLGRWCKMVLQKAKTPIARPIGMKILKEMFSRPKRVSVFCACQLWHIDVSENGGTPKSSILINRVFHCFHHPFWSTPIFGNTHIDYNIYKWSGSLGANLGAKIWSCWLIHRGLVLFIFVIN